jgi:hypothetical protein
VPFDEFIYYVSPAASMRTIAAAPPGQSSVMSFSAGQWHDCACQPETQTR